MGFGDQYWQTLLPSYLRGNAREDLISALDQFKPQGRKDISYDRFFKDFGHPYFMQGDLVLDIRTSHWIPETREYSRVYTNAIILSNSCDLFVENKRQVNSKQCLFAPLVKLSSYMEELSAAGYSPEQLEEFKRNLKSQLLSNIFYIPELGGKIDEQIALLDHVFWYPIDELKALVESIGEDRITSLNQFGYYLFVLKLSYHFCRLPEQCDRELTA
jgi:hypothetical protein